MYKVFAAFKQKYLLILLSMLLWSFIYSLSALIKMTECMFHYFGLKTLQKLNSSLAWQLWKLNVLKCNIACNITEDSVAFAWKDQFGPLLIVSGWSVIVCPVKLLLWSSVSQTSLEWPTLKLCKLTLQVLNAQSSRSCQHFLYMYFV